MKGSGCVKYYMEQAQEDYYFNRVNEPGNWFGHGAELLGLAGKVEHAPFQNLMDGFSPDRKFPWVQNAGDEHRQCGWDLTFCAPKSVSVLWALAPEAIRKQIEEAHHSAVATALDHIEKAAGVTRRGPRGAIKEPAALVFATFQHGTSREQDPHLHTHCVMTNLGLRQDGTTGTLQSQNVFDEKMTAGAIYQVQLAAGLQNKLNLVIEAEKVGFRIRGVPKKLCRKFSKRRQQIEEQLNEWGDHSAIVAKSAALVTRAKKTNTSQSELFERWQQEAEAYGWSMSQLRQEVGLPQQSPKATEPVQEPFMATANSDALDTSAKETEPSNTDRLDQPPTKLNTDGSSKSQSQKEMDPEQAASNGSDKNGEQSKAVAKSEALKTRAEQTNPDEPDLLEQARKQGENRDRQSQGTGKEKLSQESEPFQENPKKAAKPKSGKPNTKNSNPGQPRRLEQWHDEGKSRGKSRAQSKQEASHQKKKRFSCAQFLRLFKQAVAKLSPSKRTRQNLIRLATKLALQLGANGKMLHYALAHLPVVIKPIVTIEWRSPFPGPAWRNQDRDFKLPVIVFPIMGIFKGGPKRRWGKTIWRKELIGGEIRVQERTLFSHLPEWNPIRRITIPALRLTPKKPKYSRMNHSRPNEMSH